LTLLKDLLQLTGARRSSHRPFTQQPLHSPSAAHDLRTQVPSVQMPFVGHSAALVQGMGAQR